MTHRTVGIHTKAHESLLAHPDTSRHAYFPDSTER